MRDYRSRARPIVTILAGLHVRCAASLHTLHRPVADHLAELEARLAGQPTEPDRWHASAITTPADMAASTADDRDGARSRLRRMALIWAVCLRSLSARQLDEQADGVWSLRQLAFHLADPAFYADSVGALPENLPGAVSNLGALPPSDRVRICRRLIQVQANGHGVYAGDTPERQGVPSAGHDGPLGRSGAYRNELCVLLRRALSAVVCEAGDATALVVAHGANLRAALPGLTGDPDPGVDLPTGGLAALRLTPDRLLNVSVKLLSWPGTASLNQRHGLGRGSA